MYLECVSLKLEKDTKQAEKGIFHNKRKQLQ